MFNSFANVLNVLIGFFNHKIILLIIFCIIIFIKDVIGKCRVAMNLTNGGGFYKIIKILFDFY